MTPDETPRKGGSDAALFFCLLAVAILDRGGVTYPARLGLLRTAAFSGAAIHLWRGRGIPGHCGPYPPVVAAFALFSLGHAFSSVYFWSSFQHGMNIALAALLMAWAFARFRPDPAAAWRGATNAVWAMGGIQFALALHQRFVLGEPRPRGTFDNTNFLAEFLAVAAVLCLSRAFRKEEGRDLRAAASVSALLFLYGALALAASRAILLACLPALALLALSRFGFRRGTRLVLAGSVPVLALGAAAISRFFAHDPRNYARWLIWKSAARTFAENPFGVGLGGFKYLWFSHQYPVEGTFIRYGNAAIHAHSEYLDVLAGMGAAGLVLFLAVLLIPLALAASSWRVLPPERREIAAASSSALVLSGAHALLDFNFHELGLVCTGAVLAGALLSTLPEYEGRFRVALPRSLRAAAAPLFLLVLASVATMGGGISQRVAEARLREGGTERAEAAYRLAVRFDPFRADYPEALSRIQYRYFQREVRGNDGSGRADALLSRSIYWEANARDLSPNDFLIAARLSQLFAERFRLAGRPVDREAAYRLIDVAISLNPFNANLLWQRSGFLAADGRTGEAVADLERAVALEPNYCRGYAMLANLERPRNPGQAARWEGETSNCRVRAGRVPLQEHERWLVEPAEGR